MVIEQDDRDAMKSAIDANEISYGKYNVLAEESLKLYNERLHCSLVNSGSSANLLSLMVFTSKDMYKEWRLRKGDEIITVAAAFPTTVAPIVQAGCVPVFVDIGNTYNIDTKMIYKAITPKTKGIFIAHTLGIPFDITEIQHGICKRFGLFLIADNCDALGSRYNKAPISLYGDVITNSFYPAHHITSGEGGAVLTDDPVIAKIVRSMRDWGRDCECEPGHDNKCGNRFGHSFKNLPEHYDHKYVYSELGYNLKMTNVQAALLYSQLFKADKWRDIRKVNFNILDEELHEFMFSDKNAVMDKGSEPNWFGFPIFVPNNMDRGKIIDRLNANGVMTRFLFAGNILKQPMWRYHHRVVGDLDMTNSVMRQMFWIGCWHGLTKEDVVYERKMVMDALKEGLE
jgi:CDP-6-deoxy-D-xylo-4-hexulose-3-dehydrase